MVFFCYIYLLEEIEALVRPGALGQSREGQLALGLYPRGYRYEVLDLTDMSTAQGQDQAENRLLGVLRNKAFQATLAEIEFELHRRFSKNDFHPLFVNIQCRSYDCIRSF